MSFGVYFLHAPLQHLLVLSGMLNHIERPMAVLIIFLVSAVFSNFLLHTVARKTVQARVLLNAKS